MKKILFVVAVAALLAGCEETSYEKEHAKQEALSMQGNSAVGMPAINNFAEKKMMKMIIELRDQQITTITYTQDMNGKLHKLCDSQGFGLPYATQYTNPQQVTHYGAGYATLPQADPNGLFSPSSAEGTWIMCLNSQTKKMAPVYVEPRVIVSPFPLTSE